MSLLVDWGVVATLPGDLPLDDILQVGDALLAAPADGVLFTTDGGDWATAVSDLVQRAKTHMRVGVSGRGTPATIRLAAEAGAQFLVTPVFDLAALTACRHHNLLYLPYLSDEAELQEAFLDGAAAGVVADLALVQRAKQLEENGVLLVAGKASDTAGSDFLQAGASGLRLSDALFTGPEQKMADLITRVRTFRQQWLEP